MEAAALAELGPLDALETLRAWKGRYLGKQSALNVVGREMGKLTAEERPVLGQRMNAAKQALESGYAAAEAQAEAAAQQRELEREQVDVTMPGRPAPAGRLHPSTQIMREIETVFARLGFAVWESREVESDLYNFELLNLPKHHPARDMWDTFYVEAGTADEKVVLRTHTSPGQIHAMRHFAPGPTRVILPGKCYRYEPVNSRHEMQFFQIEGIAVGPGIAMTDLKGTLQEFARQILDPKTEIRFRPSYFPFTEPSVEVDASCIFCKGAGCRVCSHSGWMEILGAGMIHPTVLRNGGYDPDQVSGFAFGMGPDRIAMNKYGIDDIRHFLADDVRFLEQF